MTLADLYSEDVKALCRRFKVKRLVAFGSLVKGGFGADSDIDLIVDFEPLSDKDYKNNYFNLQFALEDRFNRPVDLLEASQVRNPFFRKDIDAYKKVVYGQ